MDNHNKRVSELFDRHMSNMASESEKQEFLEYVDDPLFADQIQDLLSSAFENQTETVELNNISSNNVLNLIFNRQQDQNNSNKNHKLWLRIPAVACIIVLLSLGVMHYVDTPTGKSKQTVAIDRVIKPGGNKAILTLANGRKIILIDELKGEIAIQNGIRIRKSTNGQLIYENNQISNHLIPSYNTIEVPVGGKWQAVLPDGTHVWLNASSSIRFPIPFLGNQRKVELKGEAYFEVAHNKAMPFLVESKGQTVEVLGTHFNVMAYEEEPIIKTTLLEGSVKISTEGKTRLLKPGEQSQVKQANIKITNNIDVEDIMAWKGGYFKFNENLESIMNKIARWYDVEVIYEFKPDPELGFGGEIMRSRELNEVLNTIQYSGKVHFKIDGRRVIVTK